MIQSFDQHGRIVLYCGDCLDKMKLIPDNSISLVLADLPYGTTSAKWDNVIPFGPLWDEYDRVVKDNGVVCLFGSEPFSSYLRMSNIQNFKYDWIWDKHNTTGFLNAKKKPLARHEIISVFSRAKLGRFTYNPQMRKGQMRTKGGYNNKPVDVYQKFGEHKSVNDMYYPTSIISIGTVYRNKNVHPTQKPVPLLEYMINTYTFQGETVLDNTMGSGSTGVAAINTGRAFVGIELEQKYFDIAKGRIEEAIKTRDGD